MSRNDGKFTPRNFTVEMDLVNTLTRNRTTHRGAVQHFRKRNVINVQRATRDLLATFFSGRRLADLIVICFGDHLTDLLLNQETTHPIANCQLPNADWCFGLKPIGNRKSTIANHGGPSATAWCY